MTQQPQTEIRGTVDPAFDEVRDVFERNFAEHGEIGAAFTVYVDGEPVVDLTGGTTTTGEPYGPDTLQMVFSSTKGATALCAHLLAQRGDLDLHAPVVEYWPEFGQNGKDQIPVSWLLSHKSGLIDTDDRLTYEQMLDWDTVVDALARSAPVWEPGTTHGYHALTYGWLVGEVVRRVSGTSIGAFFAKEVAAPLGLEFWIGLPDEQRPRVSRLVPMQLPGGMPMMAAEEGMGTASDGPPPGGLVAMLDMLLGPDNLVGKALCAPGGAAGDENVWNDPRTWSAQIPAANGVTNSRSLARMYAAMVGEIDGVRLLTDESLNAAIEPQVEGPDAVLMFPIPFALGFMRHSDFSPFAGPRSFGHYGAGGSVGFADPDRRIAVGYVMNQMLLGIAGDPRTAALIAAVDRAVS